MPNTQLNLMEQEQEILDQGQITAHYHGLYAGAGVFAGVLLLALQSKVPFRKSGAFGVVGFISTYTFISHVSFLQLRDQLQYNRMIASMKRSEENKRKYINQWSERTGKKKDSP